MCNRRAKKSFHFLITFQWICNPLVARWGFVIPGLFTGLRPWHPFTSDNISDVTNTASENNYFHYPITAWVFRTPQPSAAPLSQRGALSFLIKIKFKKLFKFLSKILFTLSSGSACLFMSFVARTHSRSAKQVNCLCSRLPVALLPVFPFFAVT